MDDFPDLAHVAREFLAADIELKVPVHASEAPVRYELEARWFGTVSDRSLLPSHSVADLLSSTCASLSSIGARCGDATQVVPSAPGVVMARSQWVVAPSSARGFTAL